MPILQWPFWILGAILQVLAVASIVKGPHRRYPVLTAYLILLLLATVAEVSTVVNLLPQETQREYLWISSAIKQVLLFIVVLELIARAGPDSPCRRHMPLIIGGAVLIAIVAFAANRQSGRIGPVMTNALAYLSFYSTLLNLVLWFLLMKNRHRDPQLLTITGGLGIQFTAEAVGHSIRNLSIPHHSEILANTGSVILALGHLLCLYFWWQALRHPRDSAAALVAASEDARC
jgi:hypothetical protein